MKLMQAEIHILRDSPQIKVTVYIKEDYLHICLLNKEIGEFYKSIFNYDALPKIIREQTDNIQELIEFLVQKREELNVKNELIEVGIECGLLRKRKIAELYLQKQQHLPQQVFQSQIRASKIYTEQLLQRLEHQKAKYGRLQTQNQQKVQQCQQLILFIDNQRKIQSQQQKITQSYKQKIEQLERASEEQEERIRMLKNQLQSERQHSIRFMRYPKQMKEIQQQQQREIEEKDKLIRQLETFYNIAEKRSITLQKQCVKYKQLYQHEKQKVQEMRCSCVAQRSSSQYIPNSYRMSQAIVVDNNLMKKRDWKQIEIIEQQSQEGSIITNPQGITIHASRAQPRENNHLNAQITHNKQRPNKGPAVRHASEYKQKPKDQSEIFAIKFDLSSLSKNQKLFISQNNLITAINVRSMTVLYSQQSITRRGQQVCTVQVQNTENNNLFLGLVVQRKNIDDLKIFIRSDGAITCRGRPTKSKKKKISSGDVVQFILNFKIGLLRIKVGSQLVDSFVLPQQFLKREVYFFAKLFGNAAIKYFEL